MDLKNKKGNDSDKKNLTLFIVIAILKYVMIEFNIYLYLRPILIIVLYSATLTFKPLEKSKLDIVCVRTMRLCNQTHRIVYKYGAPIFYPSKQFTVP